MSAYPCNVKNQRQASSLMHTAEARRRGGLYWRAGAVVALFWLLLVPCLTAVIEDPREAIVQESRRYRAQHFPDGRLPPKHDWSRQSTLQSAAAGSNEAPGGIGYGYYFK